jgi:uncharacterized phage protein gp47/JayE
MTDTIGKFTTKTWQQIHDDYLRTMRNGAVKRGITTNPQFGPGSDEEMRATAIANEIAPLNANAVIKADAQMPDTATGDIPTGQTVGVDLQRQMKIKGLGVRGASPSAGNIVLECSADSLIADGAILLDEAGLRYQVEVPGTYSDGDLVPIIALDTGAATNHDAGDTLVWKAAPPYCNSKQLVATGGLTGGHDAEDTETARARLLDRIQNPPGAGNAAQAAQYAEDSTPIVQKAFPYPAANGPSTMHIAVVGYATDVSKSRAVDATVMAGTVEPYVLGKLPEFTEIVTTTVVDQPVDVAIGLTIPSAPTASPAGTGGGWIDGTPWPALIANTKCQVTAVSPGGLSFTCDAETAPTPNVTHICTLDTATWKLLRAKVIGVSGTVGAYVITIDKPFPNLTIPNLITGATGSLIFPDAENMDTYVKAFLGAMALMGPGEKSSNVTVLTRGFRHPRPQSSFPYSIGAQQLKAVESSGDEVEDTDYHYGGGKTPDLPITISDPPFQLIPRNIGFYPI